MTVRNTFFSFSVRIRLCLTLRYTVGFYLVVVWPFGVRLTPMVPPVIPGNVAEQNGRQPSWKAPDRESEGWRWRDEAFGSAALMSFDAGGRKETGRARSAPASTSKSVFFLFLFFTRNRFHYTVTTRLKGSIREFSLG